MVSKESPDKGGKLYFFLTAYEMIGDAPYRE
jgi:hypothetical protein